MQTVWGVCTTWRTVGDGEFSCPGCGGDRNYRRRTGRRRLAVLGVPLLPRGTTGPVVECTACRERFGVTVLDRPTTARLSSLLRDAVRTLACAVLAAGGTGARTARDAALDAVRGAGDPGCTEERLLALADASAAEEWARGTGEDHAAAAPATAVPATGLSEALEPLAAHLAPVGRERLLLQGARIALADGPYRPAEREVLSTAGRALLLGPAEIGRLLDTAARTPS